MLAGIFFENEISTWAGRKEKDASEATKCAALLAQIVRVESLNIIWTPSLCAYKYISNDKLGICTNLVCDTLDLRVIVLLEGVTLIKVKIYIM